MADAFDPFASAEPEFAPADESAAPIILGGPSEPAAAEEPAAGGEFDPFSGAGAPSDDGPVTPVDSSAADVFSGIEDSKDGEAKEDEGPSAYALWEVKRKEQLDEKMEAERKAKKAIQSEAEDDRRKFLEDRTKYISGKKERNRKEEAESKAELAAVMKNGTLWEKVARLVDLTPKAGTTYKRADLVRMRSLLVQLKNEKK